ncbi:MAG: hypothetical protein MI810_14535 [Flavobacteriales bacterium]|nr:hypothetical protein [Flavobacteriales bacterium]
MTSDYRLKLEIGSAQKHDIENEKIPLVEYLRNEVKNDHLSFEYEVIELEKIVVNDSKSTFDRLVEENTSLEKFRKLFNLDIEY